MRSVLEMSNGANFHLADLHVHSPADARYSLSSDCDVSTNAGKKKFAERFVTTAMERGLSVVGITDHNSVEWVDLIRDAAAASDLVVFPGFEISTNPEAIHVVCLFEPTTPKSRLEDLITQLDLPRDERLHEDGSNRLCGKTLRELLAFVWDNGGIPIAAHVTSDHGVLNSLKGEPRIHAWRDENLVACEIPKARSEYSDATFEAETIRNERDLYERDRAIACIYSSDARSLDEVGCRSTYIKLSSLSIEGLKQAFLDWESRIRHPDELPKTNFSRLVGVKWKGAFLDGLMIHFNRNMNCLIGGKGTGKSTIIETIRYAIGLAPQGEDTSVQHDQIISEVFKAGSEVELLVEYHEPQPTEYLIRRAYNSEPVVHRWDPETGSAGEALRDLTPLDILPGVEIYGQKEILELSRNQSVQGSLLGRFIGKRTQEAFERDEADIQRALTANAKNIIGQQENLENLAELRQELAQLKERKRQYDETGLLDQLDEQRSYVQELALLDRADDEVREAGKKLAAFRESVPVDPSILAESALEGLPNRGLLSRGRQVLSDLNDSVERLSDELQEDIDKAASALGEIRGEWEPMRAEAQQRYDELVSDLDAEDVNPDDYMELERRIALLEPKLGEQGAVEDRLETLRTKREDLLDQLDDNRRSHFRALEGAAQEVNRQLENILKVEVEFAGSTGTFLDELGNLRSGARSKQLQRIVEHEDFTPRRLAEALRKGATSVESRFDVTKSTGEKLVAACDTERTFELETLRIPNSVSISFNIGSEDAPNFRSTSHLSVGQRCTAILLLILLHEPFPLLVDQPEDDLDNSFVYSDVVRRLREEKERRQFVIATHNANIPVLGDAELITVLAAEHGRLTLPDCSHGSIDDEELRVAVERILEGGREAFMLRKAKYGF